VNTDHHPLGSTNVISYGSLKLPRNRVLEGWAAEGQKAVPAGPAIVLPEGGNLWSDVSKYKVLPGADRTIYQVADLKTTNRDDRPVPVVFIYVDAQSGRAFSFLQVEPVTYWTAKRSAKKLWLVPFTIPLDLATIPIQLPYMLLMMNSTKS